LKKLLRNLAIQKKK